MPQPPDPRETLPLDRPPPAAFSRYRLLAEMGRGGMGVVWRAQDTKLHREVALKFLPEIVVRDREAMADLAAETRRCLELTHPHIVRVYDLFEEGNRAAISMEFVDGPSLAERKLLQPDRCFSAQAIGHWIAQLCSALDYAHRKVHIVHRDLKPLNLLVNHAGDLKVVDFGIARSLRTSETRLSVDQRAPLMSLAYVGPQQLLNEPAAVADDIYSLGATIYELLTSKPPFYEGDIQTQLREVVPPTMAARRVALGIEGREPIPAVWEQIVAACLAKDPAARPGTAGEVAARLGLPTVSVTVSHPPWRAAVASPRRHVTGSLSAILAVVVILAWFVWRPAPRVDSAPATPPTVPAEILPSTAPPEDPPPLPLPTPEFVVTVHPPDVGARVWLGRQADLPVPPDGRLRVQDVRDDEHVLTVQAPGHQAYTTRIEPKEGSGSIEVQLVPVFARVTIEARAGTVVSAVDVRGQGKILGTVPPTGPLLVESALTVGTYLFKFTHPDCLEVEKPDVALRPGRTNRIVAAQVAAPGELRVFSVPAAADVLVNGTKLGVTPATLVQPAEKPLQVVVSLPGHRRFQQTVSLKPRETRPINAGTLVAESGTLELRIDGLDSLVRKPVVRANQRVVSLVNGRVAGLDAGEQALEVTHPDYLPWKGKATVIDGQVVPVVVKLLPKPAALTLQVSGPPDYTVRANGQPLAVKQGRLMVPAAQPVELEVSAKGYKTERRALSLPANGAATLALELIAVPLPQPGEAWTIPALDLTLQPIPAGSFAMGSTANTYELPITQVTLSKPYWLGKTEVTQRQWSVLMGANPAQFKGEQRPVENVTWSAAMEFCQKLTEQERAADRLPEGYVYTLPSEAQWEYACRAGAADNLIADPSASSWNETNGAATTHPVGTRQANAWGLHDMLGNVWEWCSDSWAEKLPGGTLQLPVNAKSAKTTPRAAAAAGSRVRRGGSFTVGAGALRYSLRGKGDPGYQHPTVGFRIALVPTP